MVEILQRTACNAKTTAVLIGILMLLVGVSNSPAAPPKKSAASAEKRRGTPADPPKQAAVPSDESARDSKLTRANYELIHSGMTEDAVTAILGPPGGSSKNVGTFNGRPFDHKGMIWKMSDWSVTIQVKFNDGKVSDKSWTKLTPQQQAEIDYWMKAAAPKPQK